MAVFKFRNQSAEAVTLKKVTSSCGCTTANLDKTKISPGETGQIDAKFVFEGRNGRQVKTISVLTDESNKEWQALTLIVDIPEPLELDKKQLSWKLNEKANTQKIIVKLVDSNHSLGKISVTSERIKFDVVEVVKGISYTIDVTPLSTSSPVSALLLIQINGKTTKQSVIPLRISKVIE